MGLQELIESMTAEEAHAAIRFCETCDDDEGYAVPRKMMKRMEELGLVIDKKFGRFEQTELLIDLRDALDVGESAERMHKMRMGRKVNAGVIAQKQTAPYYRQFEKRKF